MATMTTYEHVGTQPLEIGDHGEGKPAPRVVKPGAVFDADLTPEQEAFWIRCGAIRLHDRREPKRALDVVAGTGGKATTEVIKP